MSVRLRRRYLLALPIVASLFCLFGLPGDAKAVDEEWTRFYSGSGGENDEAVEIKTDPAGNAYVTGWSWGAGPNRYDIVTLKYDPSGNQEWVRVFDRGGTWDQGKGIAVDDAGNAYVIGYSDGAQVTIKYASNGDQEWAAVYPAASLLSFNKNQDVEVDGDGNVYVCGHRYSQPTGQDVLVLKYLPTGSLAWDRFHGSPGLDDEAWNLAVDGGQVYVTGSSHLGGENFDIVTLKFDSTGVPLWIRTYDGAAHQRDIGYSIAANPSGVYVCGVSFVAGHGIDAVTLKYDPAGNPLPVWTATYNGLGNDFDGLVDLAVDEQQNVYVAGQTANQPFPNTDFDYLIVKYDFDGSESWVQTYDGPAPGSNDYAYELEVDGDGNVFVTGDEFEGPTPADNDRNIVTLHYDTLGFQVWLMKYDGPGRSVDYGRSLALGRDYSNVYVCGLADLDITNPGIDYDYVTIKYGQEVLAVDAGPAPRPRGKLHVVPNPFAAFAAIPGRGGERISVIDASGRLVGRYLGERIGADLSPGVYFVILPEQGMPSLRMVKLR